MEKSAVMIQFSIEQKMTIEVEQYEETLAQYDDVWERRWEERWLKSDAIKKFMHNMTGEEIKQLLIENLREVTVYESLGKVVKLAIDDFDPYGLTYDVPNEYDPLSARITDDIDIYMSAEEIAEVIADEFNFSFTPNYTVERCMRPAKKIHYYLNTK